MAIHLIDAEIFQSGPKWWSEHCHPQIHAASKAIEFRFYIIMIKSSFIALVSMIHLYEMATLIDSLCLCAKGLLKHLYSGVELWS